MDDLVRQAMAKWPNVPDCFGWLALDARGQWYMRDDRTQAAGPFPQSKGAVLRHEKLIDFIHRNYEADTQGRWYFQNGPQRVYVELESTPWIFRIEPDGSVMTHTGQTAQVEAVWLDESGRLYLAADIGFGLVYTLDVGRAADRVEAGDWAPRDVDSQSLEQQFAYVRSPQARLVG